MKTLLKSMVKMLLDHVSHLSNESHSKFRWYRLKSACSVKKVFKRRYSVGLPHQSLDTRGLEIQTSPHTSQTGKLFGEPECIADEKEEEFVRTNLLN